MATDNWDTRAAWAYHEETKHSPASLRSNAHHLDWANQPLPFKVYPTLQPLALPHELLPVDVPALARLSAPGEAPAGEQVPDLKALARLLFFSAGITRKRSHPGGQIFFRAAACTGALYHIELYLVCGDLPGLEAGLYHFGSHDFALRRLRQGDYRGALIDASGQEPALAQAPAALVLTGTYWRNTWKYQARSYRHSYWDSGTILANLLATAVPNVPARVVLGFADGPVSRLLGLDTDREAALALVPLGRGGPPPGPPPDIGHLGLETVPLSKSEVDYPAIRAMHAASSLDSPEAAEAWRSGAPGTWLPEPSGGLVPLHPYGEDEAPRLPVEQVILRRGSTRRFAREPITASQLATVLHHATRGVPTDYLQPPDMLNDLYLIVNAVEGLPSGVYLYRWWRGALELLKEGDFRDRAGFLGLEQELPADASVDVFFLTDLDRVLGQLGNRGYRAAQLEAGVMGGRLYLAAYALGLGASGLTFYDDEVTAFFSPHAAGKSAMFLVALGRSARARK